MKYCIHLKMIHVALTANLALINSPPLCPNYWIRHVIHVIPFSHFNRALWQNGILPPLSQLREWETQKGKQLTNKGSV